MTGGKGRFGNVEQELERNLAASHVDDAKYLTTVAGVKKALKEFIRELVEEFAQFPQGRYEAHFTLTMKDFCDPAMFVILIVDPSFIEMVAGRGHPQDVRDWAEGPIVKRPTRAIADARRRFALSPGTVRVDRKNADEWLASS